MVIIKNTKPKSSITLMLIEFKVPDMACAACADKIVTAIQAISPHAEVTADPQTKLVVVNSDQNLEQIKTVVINAGYTVLTLFAA
jgi:copper chaperone